MPTKYLSQFTIKIDGANVSETFYDAIEEVTVDSSLEMPSMFTIRLRDHDFVWVDDSTLAIGKAVEISVVKTEGQNPVTTKLFKGELTALEPSFSAAGATFMAVRGYDKSHRLHLGRKSRTFLSKKDSDIASTVASEAGLSIEKDETSGVHDYIVQFNQTNMEFLLARAALIGYQVYVEDAKLYFKKNTVLPASVSASLEYAEDLISFEPRWTVSQQANKVNVKGWDPSTKQAISSEVATNQAVKQGGMASAASSVVSGLQEASQVLVRQSVITSGDATALANGVIADLGLEFVQAEGYCYGNPNVRAGKKIEIKHVGTRFSGNYFVTSALHIYNRSGYFTRFSISGRHPYTFSHLVGGGSSAGSSGSISGVVPAVVTNIKDPEDLGRIKVKFPWLDDSVESHWLRIASPMAGAGRGLVLMPEVNDEVLIAFEHGDVHRPYMVGALWHSKDKTPYVNSAAVDSSGVVNVRAFKTRTGHLFEFDDKTSQGKVTLKTVAGHEIILDDKSGSEKISIKDKSGNTMVIDSTKNSLTIDVKGDFNVTSKGKISLSSTGNIDITTSAGNTTVKGMKLALEASGVSELKGAKVTVNGTGGAELTSSGIVQVQGSLVKIN